MRRGKYAGIYRDGETLVARRSKYVLELSVGHARIRIAAGVGPGWYCTPYGGVVSRYPTALAAYRYARRHLQLAEARDRLGWVGCL